MSLLAQSFSAIARTARQRLTVAAAYTTAASQSPDINSILGESQPSAKSRLLDTNTAVLSKLLPSLKTSSPKPSSSTDSSPTEPSSHYSIGSEIQKKIVDPFSHEALNAFHEDQLRLRLYAKCTRNNTILTLCREDGTTLGWASGGACGFKSAQKASYEAGYQCAVQIFNKILRQSEKEKDKRVALHVLFSGRGQGREALFKALTSVEGDDIRGFVNKLTDRTPIKIGGTRAKKARRL